MKRIILILISVLSAYQIHGQTVNFELVMPEDVVKNSLYNSIECINEMQAHQNLGRINYPSKIEIVVERTSIQTQLNTLMQHITDQTAGSRTLVLHIRDLFFGEGGDKNTLCHIRMNLYEKDDADYRLIGITDQLLSDNPKQIMTEASHTITSFIADNLTKEPMEGAPYTLDEVKNITSVEKAETPLYTTATFKDGIYLTYLSFADQQPEVQEIQAKVKDNILKEVKILNAETNKWEKVKPESVYAIVADGNAYISKDKKYYRIYRDMDDLKFVAEESAGHSVRPMGSFGVSTGNRGTGFGGGIGIVIGPKKKDKVTYMIDHLNGDFIFVRIND